MAYKCQQIVGYSTMEMLTKMYREKRDDTLKRSGCGSDGSGLYGDTEPGMPRCVGKKK